MRCVLLVLLSGLLFSSVGTRAADSPKEWVFVGTTEAAAAADLRARVTGQLTHVFFREGDAVKKGDVLAEIDSSTCRFDFDAAKARQMAAEAKLQAARIKAANAKRLQQNKVISEDEVALSVAGETEMAAALAVAKAEVDRAQLNLAWTRVTAPFDGRVARVHTTEGNLVVADKTLVLRVVSVDTLSVAFNVPESVVLRLRGDGRSGLRPLDVAVGFANEEGFPHVVKKVSFEPEVDPKTGMARFRATVPNPEGLISPGMSARVRLAPVAK